jgi:hypothetical protein
VVYGDICRTLFKVSYRITTRGHHITYQLVGLRYRTSRGVNEPRLNPEPELFEAVTIAWRERSDVESLDAIFALFEVRFCKSPVTAFLYSAGIFSRTKLRAQSFGPALFEKKERGDAHDHDHGDDSD